MDNEDDEYVTVENDTTITNNITLKDMIEFNIRFLNDQTEINDISDLPSPVEKRFQLADEISDVSLCKVITTTKNIIQKVYPLLKNMRETEYNSYINSLVIPKNIKKYFIDKKELIHKKTYDEMTSTAFLNCIFN
jgi:hypothetical protein